MRAACVPSHFSRVQLFAVLWTIVHLALCPWDSPGKNTGAGCHGFVQQVFPDPGVELASCMSPALAGGFFTT